MHLLLREILGPSVLQFPWFNKHEIQLEEFLRRLRLFLQRVKNLPSVRFVIEIRNKKWLDKRVTDLLREHNVAVLRQNSATAETFPGDMLHDASVCCSFQTRSRFWRRTGALAILFTMGYMPLWSPVFCRCLRQCRSPRRNRNLKSTT
jgi:uncharacterized protein YecE (DUF72 family)